MRVVHICTSTGGGAGSSTRRLHGALLARGVDSWILCREATRTDAHTHVVYRPRAVRVADRLRLPVSRHTRNRRLLLGLLRGRRKDYEVFTFPRTDFDVARHPLIRTAEVVHLHWIADFVDYPTFFRRVDKPLVWTLHDMNPLLGGFHFPADRERNAARFAGIEERLMRVKARAVASAPCLHVVAPSVWLADQARSSAIFRERPVELIPYGIDVGVYRPLSRPFCRTVFGLPEQRLLVLFVSLGVETRRKGFDLLMAAVHRMRGSADVDVVTAGLGGRGLPGVTHVGWIEEPRLMTVLINAADMVVIPSHEDNLPNVMLEALACGTPVLGTRVGGIPDAIEDGINGWLARDATVEGIESSLRRAIHAVRFLDRDRIRRDAVARFAMDVQATRYEQLYGRVVAARAGSGS